MMIVEREVDGRTVFEFHADGGPPRCGIDDVEGLVAWLRAARDRRLVRTGASTSGSTSTAATVSSATVSCSDTVSSATVSSATVGGGTEHVPGPRLPGRPPPLPHR